MNYFDQRDPVDSIVGATPNISFDAIVATSASDVWIAGSYSQFDHGPTVPAFEHWNGSRWNLQPIPRATVEEFEDSPTITAIGALAGGRHSLWAAGFSTVPFFADQVDYPFLRESDGTSWRSGTWRPPTGRDMPNYGYFNAAALGPNGNVWVAGTFDGEPYAEQGSLMGRWTQANIPPAPAGSGSLNAIDVISDQDVWAAGIQQPPHPQSPVRSLIEHWNGSTWTRVADAFAGRSRVQLDGVASTSRTDVWAVGVSHGSSNVSPPHAVVERWNETAWTSEPVTRRAKDCMAFQPRPVESGPLVAQSTSAATAESIRMDRPGRILH